MGIIRDLLSILAGLIDLVRDPEEYQFKAEQRWKQKEDQKREELIKRYGSLELVTQFPDQVRRFDTLEEAIDFIAKCLERDAPSELSAEIERMQSWKEAGSNYAVSFIEGVFLQWKDFHEKYDLRSAEYSEDQEMYKLRFPEIVPIGLNLDFAKRSDGWVIQDAYLTR
jgi:hypothetical protein